MLWNARSESDVLINAIVYAEVSSGFDSLEAVDTFLNHVTVRREDVPWAAAYAAGRTFNAYRNQGGGKTSPLPDFFIAAHAALCDYQLLSRDGGFFRNYFPGLKLIHPDTHP